MSENSLIRKTCVVQQTVKELILEITRMLKKADDKLLECLGSGYRKEYWDIITATRVTWSQRSRNAHNCLQNHFTQRILAWVKSSLSIRGNSQRQRNKDHTLSHSFQWIFFFFNLDPETDHRIGYFLDKCKTPISEMLHFFYWVITVH